MRILFIHQFFCTPENGAGEQLRFYYLGKHLVSQGHEVMIITGNSRLKLSLGNKRIGLLQVDGLAVITFNLDYRADMTLLQKRRVFLSFARQAALQGRKLPRPDLIVADVTPLTVSRPAVSLSRHYGVPLVLEIRERWLEGVVRRGTLRNKAVISWFRRMEQNAFEQASRLVTLSADLARSIRQDGGNYYVKTAVISADPAEEFFLQQYTAVFRKASGPVPV